MKFGPVPLAQAHGAVLAHSETLGKKRLRKGKVLDDADLAALAGAGLTEITVARLEPGDLDEDSAATKVARALVAGGSGLRLSPAHTGRVNVIADAAGLARIDAAAIDVLNAVDPMITVATVPPLHRMDPGGLVATIKIIAYGVAGGRVAQAVAVGRRALTLLQPKCPDVAMIETTTGADLGDKGQKALEIRLARLGVGFAGRQVVGHDIDPLASALRAQTASVICILTGSATSDLYDTAPQALRAAGGQVDYFGMPVDPGNLLFIGRLGHRPVIGLPGCARSPALNGADWVLERVLCGVPVTGQDIARMGVGGLLKEIPARGKPRRDSD